jgi:hypothetical protein
MTNPTNPTRRRPKTPLPNANPDHRSVIARRLDLLADCELQAGHHAAAEQLAWRAAEMREAGHGF